MSGKFGWSLPPGVSHRDIDPSAGPCDVCGHSEDNCICPECPVCSAFGLLQCYTDHGLRMTIDQEIGRQKMEQSNLRDQITSIQQYIDELDDLRGDGHGG